MHLLKYLKQATRSFAEKVIAHFSTVDSVESVTWLLRRDMRRVKQLNETDSQFELSLVNVKIGAHCLKDPIGRFLVLMACRPTLLVEADSLNFSCLRTEVNALNKHPQGRAAIECVHGAIIGGLDGAESRSLFRLKSDDFGQWASTLSSVDSHVLEWHFNDGWVSRCAREAGKPCPVLADVSQETTLCFPLSALLNGFPPYTRRTGINFLFIDAEGCDFGIVKEALTLAFLPRLILFEHKHMTLRQFALLCSLLRKNGYVIAVDGINTLAQRH